MQRWEERAHRWRVNAEQRRLRRKSRGREFLRATDAADGPPSEDENSGAEATVANVTEAVTEQDAAVAA